MSDSDQQPAQWIAAGAGLHVARVHSAVTADTAGSVPRIVRPFPPTSGRPPRRPGAMWDDRLAGLPVCAADPWSPMTTLTVIGCGYLGAVHAACMAQLGHDVLGIDVDASKVASLNAGTPTFFEPGFPEVLQASLATGRLSFSADMADAKGRKVHFVCVGTPQKRNEYAADLAYVDAAVAALAPYLSPGDLVVGK